VAREGNLSLRFGPSYPGGGRSETARCAMSRVVLFLLRDLLVLRLKRLFGRSSVAMLEQENAALRDELRLLRRAAKR
jgi:hypothetical protein